MTDPRAASGTPRVDAEEQWAEWNGVKFPCVHSNVARDLEHELVAARAWISYARLTSGRFVERARDMALEDAATVCEESYSHSSLTHGIEAAEEDASRVCAAAIRALKSGMALGIDGP